MKQEKNACGAASIAMVMQYWQRQQYCDLGSVPDSAEIQKAIYSSEGRGIYASEMEHYFKRAWVPAICISRKSRRPAAAFGKGPSTDRCAEAFRRRRDASLCCGGRTGCGLGYEERSRRTEAAQAGANGLREGVESGWKLDSSGRTPRNRSDLSVFAFLALIIVFSSVSVGQNPPESSDLTRLKQLVTEGSGRWQDIVAWVERSSRAPELNYYAGVALAHLGRFDESRERLREGQGFGRTISDFLRNWVALLSNRRGMRTLQDGCGAPCESIPRMPTSTTSWGRFTFSKGILKGR